MSDIRDTLFGDMPFDAWTATPSEEEPWKSFKLAKASLDKRENSICASILQEITSRKGLESRHYLQAWMFLKPLGITPAPEIAKRVLGVVVEVGMNSGLDLLAGYEDFSARYYNYSGAAVIWEKPDTSLNEAIARLIVAAQVVANVIGPWDEPRPPQPKSGKIRINMLTPSGLHFGEAPFETLSKDRLGGPVVAAATQLMQRLIQKTKK
jgi:hypothetical protein